MVCGLIGFAIYLLRPPDDGPRVKGAKLTIDDVISTKYVAQPLNGTWISGKQAYIQILNTYNILWYIFTFSKRALIFVYKSFRVKRVQ